MGHVLSHLVGNGAYMGVSSSTLNKLVHVEFTRLAKGRAYITLDEVLEFRLHSGGWDISTDCIGVLFSIDRWVPTFMFCSLCCSVASSCLHDRVAEIHLVGAATETARSN